MVLSFLWIFLVIEGGKDEPGLILSILIPLHFIGHKIINVILLLINQCYYQIYGYLDI